MNAQTKHCLICRDNGEIGFANPKYQPHAIVCDDCAHDCEMFVECQACGKMHPSNDTEIISYDSRVYCDHDCFDHNASDEDYAYGTWYGNDAWSVYNACEAKPRPSMASTGQALSSALSTALGA